MVPRLLVPAVLAAAVSARLPVLGPAAWRPVKRLLPTFCKAEGSLKFWIRTWPATKVSPLDIDATIWPVGVTAKELTVGALAATWASVKAPPVELVRPLPIERLTLILTLPIA